jgi:hypothetical protein
LKGHINSTGFPLQIGLQNEIDESTSVTGWKTIYSEHSWKNPDTNESGFIDLVIANKLGNCILNVECKRVRDTSWIFLKDKNAPSLTRRHAKAFVVRKENHQFTNCNWEDVTMEPSTPQSSFCVIPGTDNRSKSLIERSASELVVSTEGLADEQNRIYSNTKNQNQLYFNVIVTTATLQLSEYDIADFSLKSGTFDKIESKEVPYIRYRKQLKHVSEPPAVSGQNYKDIASYKESTIFIVNSMHFIDFLSKLEVDSH